MHFLILGTATLNSDNTYTINYDPENEVYKDVLEIPPDTTMVIKINFKLLANQTPTLMLDTGKDGLNAMIPVHCHFVWHESLGMFSSLILKKN